MIAKKGTTIEQNDGVVEIVEVINQGKFLVKFIDTGFTCYATKSQLFNKKIKDKTKHKTRHHETVFADCHFDLSERWCRTFDALHRRCQKRQSYSKVEICEEWHVASAFKSWFDKQDNQELDLDSDIIPFLTNQPKRYSPETCFFVSRKINSSFGRFRVVLKQIESTRDKLNLLSEQEIQPLPYGCRRRNGSICVTVANTTVGTFTTIEEALNKLEAHWKNRVFNGIINDLRVPECVRKLAEENLLSLRQ